MTTVLLAALGFIGIVLVAGGALLAFALCAVAARADAAGNIPPAAPVEDAARRVA